MSCLSLLPQFCRVDTHLLATAKSWYGCYAMSEHAICALKHDAQPHTAQETPEFLAVTPRVTARSQQAVLRDASTPGSLQTV